MISAIALLILFLIVAGGLAMGGVMYVKHSNQALMDKERTAYVLTFPAELSTEQVLEWAEQTISSLYVSGYQRMFGHMPTMAFVVDADASGIKYRLYIPYKHAKPIIGQLHTLIPGMHVDRAPTKLGERKWKAVVELGEKNPTRTLRIQKPKVLSHSILNSLQPLQPDEHISWQLVVSPAVHQAMPSEQRPVQSARFSYRSVLGPTEASKDEINDRRAKLGEMNILAVLRIAADADKEETARNRLMDVRSSLMSTSNAHNRLVETRTPRKLLLERIATAGAPKVRFPMQLSLTELVSMLAWPLENPHVAGLPRGRTRQIPATDSVARAGLVTGDATFPGGERPIAVSAKNSLRHIYTVGPSGSGKSTTAGGIILQAINEGHGCAVLDPKNDKKDGIFYTLLNSIPKHRINDVIVVDVLDTAYPVGFNLLQGNPTTVAADLQGLFDHIYPNTAQLLMPQTLFHSLMTLMTSKGAEAPLTFADIRALCLPRDDQEEFSKRLIAGIANDDELDYFWKKVDSRKGQRETIFNPLDTRIWQLLGRREIRNIIGQSESGFNMRDALMQNKIILINVGGHGRDTAKLIGSLFLNAIWSEVRTGATSQAKPFYLCMDEFQEFTNLSTSLKELMNQARAFGTPMVLANQYTEQLPRETKDAVMNNTASQIVFRTDSDAATYARKFGNKVSADDFQHLHAFETIQVLATDDGVSGPITAKTRPPTRQTGSAQAVINQSRAKYSRPVAEVEQEIKARQRVMPKQRKSRPKRGSVEWEEE